jgi:hypothetical protein
MILQLETLINCKINTHFIFHFLSLIVLGYGKHIYHKFEKSDDSLTENTDYSVATN